jgi:hypothetical protein
MQFVLFSVLALVLAVGKSAALVQEDIFIPDHCMNIAEPTDHVLVKYSISYDSIDSVNSPPFDVVHVHVNALGGPIHQGLQGMCPDAIRLLTFTIEDANDMMPFFPAGSFYAPMNEEVKVNITVVHVTSAKDFQIFDALNKQNVTLFLDLVENHTGINAFDEGGSTPLMIAAQLGGTQLIASLLNARMPRANVNLAKQSGYTALFYAVNHPQTTVLQALLRRGANPNVALKNEDSAGNTPLHFACLMEKMKHIELLLQYGADVEVRNQYGQSPIDMVPTDAVRSLKQRVAYEFKEAQKKKRAAADAAAKDAVAKEL